MAHARPAPLPAELPDAGTARRRARTGVCLLGALPVLPFTIGALPGAREAGAPLGLLTGTQSPIAARTGLRAMAVSSPVRFTGFR